MKNILIIAPHADDEILGCGGSISYFRESGYKIFVAIMTNANQGDSKLYTKKYINKVRAEATNAHKLLKISETFFFDFPAPKLDQEPIASISKTILDLINKIKPEKTFIPHIGDSHIDHQIIHKASLVALRPINKFQCPEIFSYETLSESEWGLKDPSSLFMANCFIKLSKNQIDKKIEAFGLYKSQIKKYPHPRSKKNILNLAKYRGSNICIKYAEAFYSIRILK